MMKDEFEAIAGYEVSGEDYRNIIEPMYMATELSKEDFVKCIDKKRFALKPLNRLVKEMRQCADRLMESCTHYTDYATKNRLETLVKEYVDRKYGEYANYYISTKELFTCYYPYSLEICGRNSGKIFETIKLV